MLENLVLRPLGLALLHGVRNSGVDKNDIEYVVDCAEEACGDMNQRGGGSLAKSAAEIAGLARATGSDCRSFCAGPAHAIVEAARSWPPAFTKPWPSPPAAVRRSWA
jgi:hypothetical protein